jgi:hypothetical protein
MVSLPLREASCQRVKQNVSGGKVGVLAFHTISCLGEKTLIEDGCSAGSDGEGGCRAS